MKIIKIGNQNWATENLTADKYLNGDPIPVIAFLKTMRVLNIKAITIMGMQ